MSSRVEISPTCEADVTVAVDRWLDTRLGPDIAADAQRFCPVRTGFLRSNIRWQVHNGQLRVGSNVRYHGYVECGTRHMAPRPHLRPALYQVRTG